LSSLAHSQRSDEKCAFHITEPAFAIAFKDAAYGFATMQAKNKQLAFMTGIQDKSIQIKGNPALVIWFQGLTKYLKPRKAKAKAKA
jgi:Neuraminidase (sialidase)